MKAIIVTGGTRGIGRTIVESIVERMLAGDASVANARLVVTYRSGKAHANSLADELLDKGIAADVLPMDLACTDSIDSFVKLVRGVCESVQALINNAGSTNDGSFLSMPDELVGGLIEANLSGTIYLTEKMIPLLQKAGSTSIVFMASAAGVYGKGGQVPYATTKGGLIGYTQLLARRYGREKIFINAVAPGFIATDMVVDLDPIMYEPILNNSSIGAMGAPRDVAHVVCGLLTPGYVQATTVKVDGGHLR
jgi:3-oxoacyl-[acyl-carrier protein] reductase